MQDPHGEPQIVLILTKALLAIQIMIHNKHSAKAANKAKKL